MTIDISDNSSRISYTVAQNVTQQSFAIPFEFFDDSDISVYVDETLKVITTDYSISGGNGSTGTVTFNTAGEGETQQVLGAAGGSTVTIVRFTTIERTTDFTTGADINRAALNTQLDTLTAIAADNKDRTDRALHISNTEIAPNLELPSINARKGRVLDFHPTSGAVQAGPLSNDIATIANNIAEILAADSEAAAAAASATSASASASTATTKASEAAASATAAETAEANAETAQVAAEAAQTAAEAAQTAAEAIDVITDATATATTLAAGASATVSVTATNGTGAFTFGIPTGPAGAAAPVLTASEIKTSYESNSNTNAYTDAEKTKLTNIEALADVTDTANVVAALTAGTNVSIAADGTISSTDTNTTYSVGDGGLTTNDFTDADHTKLDGIEAGATADQTAAQIKTAYESNADTNEFSDAEKTKLAGIETSATADQTASEIRALVESATDSNVFTDNNLTKLNGIETGATADQTGLQIKTRYEGEADTNAFTDAEKTKLTALDTTAEENQNAYASFTILNASGSVISGTSALNKQELLVLQEGPGVSINKINTQQFQISAIPDLYSSFEVSPTAQPSATGDNAVAIGDGALGYGDDAISIGESSEATGNKSIALGKSALSSGVESVALGKSASIGVSSVSIGITGGFTYGSVGVNSIAIGQLAKATQANSIAIGDAALSATANLIALGGTTDTVQISGAYTLPTTDGTNGQVLTTDGSGAVTFANAGGGGAALQYFAEDANAPPTAPSATGTYAVAIGDNSTASGIRATAIGGATCSGNSESIAIGSGAVSSANVSTAIGPNSDATSAGSLAIGYSAQAVTGSYATAVSRAYASGADSFAAAIANNTSSYGATGSNSVAIGQTVKSTATAAVSIGRNAIASGQDSVAIGLQCTADASNSIALGSYSSTKGVKGRIAFSGVSSNYQQGTFVLAKQTADATPSVLTYNTAGASTDNQVILPNNSAYSFSGTIIARESAAAGSDYASWEIKGALLRDANAASTVLGNGIQNKLYATSGASAWDIALTADTTNGGLKIEVTGAAATNIRWVATVNTSEVTYA